MMAVGWCAVDGYGGVVKADPTQFADKLGLCERRVGGGCKILASAPKFGISLTKKGKTMGEQVQR